jgi:antitoxin FitA
MCCTCIHAVSMSRMIQLRNVPEDLHRTLKSRAAAAGMSLSDYLLREIRQFAERPTVAELRERVRRRRVVVPPLSPANTVRQERDSR